MMSDAFMMFSPQVTGGASFGVAAGMTTIIPQSAPISGVTVAVFE